MFHAIKNLKSSIFIIYIEKLKIKVIKDKINLLIIIDKKTKIIPKMLIKIIKEKLL
jgi:hypothetical protein